MRSHWEFAQSELNVVEDPQTPQTALRKHKMTPDKTSAKKHIVLPQTEENSSDEETDIPEEQDNCFQFDFSHALEYRAPVMDLFMIIDQ